MYKIPFCLIKHISIKVTTVSYLFYSHFTIEKDIENTFFVEYD